MKEMNVLLLLTAAVITVGALTPFFPLEPSGMMTIHNGSWRSINVQSVALIRNALVVTVNQPLCRDTNASAELEWCFNTSLALLEAMELPWELDMHSVSQARVTVVSWREDDYERTIACTSRLPPHPIDLRDDMLQRAAALLPAHSHDNVGRYLSITMVPSMLSNAAIQLSVATSVLRSSGGSQQRTTTAVTSQFAVLPLSPLPPEEEGTVIDVTLQPEGWIEIAQNDVIPLVNWSTWSTSSTFPVHPSPSERNFMIGAYGACEWPSCASQHVIQYVPVGLSIEVTGVTAPAVLRDIAACLASSIRLHNSQHSNITLTPLMCNLTTISNTSCPNGLPCLVGEVACWFDVSALNINLLSNVTAVLDGAANISAVHVTTSVSEGSAANVTGTNNTLWLSLLPVVMSATSPVGLGDDSKCRITFPLGLKYSPLVFPNSPLSAEQPPRLVGENRAAAVISKGSSLSMALLPYVASVIGGLGALCILTGALCRLLSKRMWSAALWSVSFIFGVVCLILVGVGYDEESQSFEYAALIEVYAAGGCQGPPLQLLLVDAYIVSGDADEDSANAALTCGRWVGLGDIDAPRTAAAATTTGGAACVLDESNGLLRPVAVSLSPSRETCEVEIASQLRNESLQWQQCQTTLGTQQSMRVMCIAAKELPTMWSQWRTTFNAFFDVQWGFGTTRINDSEGYPTIPWLSDVMGVARLTIPYESNASGAATLADSILTANTTTLTNALHGFTIEYNPPMALFSGNSTIDVPFARTRLGQRIQGLAPALGTDMLSALRCNPLDNASNCGSSGATYRCDEGGRPLLLVNDREGAANSGGAPEGVWCKGSGSGTASWDLADCLNNGANAFSIVWWMKLTSNKQIASTLFALTEALSLDTGKNGARLVPAVEVLARETSLGVLAADPTDDLHLPSSKSSLELGRALHKKYRVRPRSNAKAAVRSGESHHSPRGDVYAAVEARSIFVPVADSGGINEVTLSIVSKVAGSSSAITWRFADSANDRDNLPQSVLQSESGLRSVLNVLSKSVGDIPVDVDEEGAAPWHHIAIVCQAKNPVMECHLFLDGSTSLLSMGWRQCSAESLPQVRVGRGKYAITVPSLQSAMQFGETTVKCGSSTLNGSIGGVQVFPVALSRSQIKALMNSAALDESQRSGSIALIVIGLASSAISIVFAVFDFVRETRADNISRQRAKEVLIRQQFEDVDADGDKCGEDSFLRILRNDARSKQMGAQCGAAAKSGALGLEQSKAASTTVVATGSQTTVHLRFLISSVLYVGQMLSVYFSNWSWPAELTDVVRRFVSWLTFDFNTQLLYNYIAPAVVVSLTGVVGVLFSAVIGDDNKRHQRMVSQLTQGVIVAKAAPSISDDTEMRSDISQSAKQSAVFPSMQRLMDLQMENIAQQMALESVTDLTREEHEERLRELMQEQTAMILQQKELIHEAQQRRDSTQAEGTVERRPGGQDDAPPREVEVSFSPREDSENSIHHNPNPDEEQHAVEKTNTPLREGKSESTDLAFKVLLHTTTKDVLPLTAPNLLETIQRVVHRCNVGNVVGETDSCESILNGEHVTLSISATFTNGKAKTITTTPASGDSSYYGHGKGSAIAAVRKAVKQRMRQSSVTTDNAVAIECYATPHEVASLTGATRGFLSILPNPPVVMCPRHERRVVFAFASHRQKLKYGTNQGDTNDNHMLSGARCAFNSDLGVMYHKVIGHPRCPCFGEDGSNLLYGHLDYFYCPFPGCAHIVCECCFDGSLFDLMRSIFAGSIEVLREMGVMQVVGFVVLLVAQLLLAPVMQTCAMIIMCHAKYQCQFPGCYDAPSVTFVVYLVLATLTLLAMSSFISILLAVTIQRKKHLVRCVTPSTAEKPWTGLFYSLPHDVWRVFLDRDTSLLKSQYEAYRFRFVWIHSVVLILKSLAVLPSVFAVPDGLAQLGGALAVEMTLLALVTFVQLYNDKWIALMARCASVHQTIQLSLNVWLQTIVIPPTQLIQTLSGALSGPTQGDADSTRSKLSRAMLYVLAAYLCSVVAILLISVVFPIMRLKMCNPGTSVKGRAARYAV